MSEPGQPQPVASSIAVAAETEEGGMQNASESSESRLLDTSMTSESNFTKHDFKAEPIRDAGGGKVRGPNGRYLPKDDVSSGPKKVKKQKVKARKHSPKVVEQSKSLFIIAVLLHSYICCSTLLQSNRLSVILMWD